jgi:sialate O-acetylesterase
MWRECTEPAETFSAVAITDAARSWTPVGPIQTAWGATPIDGWTSLGAISQDPALMPVFTEFHNLMQEHALALLRYDRAAKDWEKAAIRLKSEGKPLPPVPDKPVGPGGPWTPGGLFNAMVAPITPFAIRGVIWYQGEANASTTRAPLYGRLFQTMISDWRPRIGDFSLPLGPRSSR